jgi:citrate lyase synthetase
MLKSILCCKYLTIIFVFACLIPFDITKNALVSLSLAMVRKKVADEEFKAIHQPFPRITLAYVTHRGVLSSYDTDAEVRMRTLSSFFF